MGLYLEFILKCKRGKLITFYHRPIVTPQLTMVVVVCGLNWQAVLSPIAKAEPRSDAPLHPTAFVCDTPDLAIP